MNGLENRGGGMFFGTVWPLLRSDASGADFAVARDNPPSATSRHFSAEAVTCNSSATLFSRRMSSSPDRLDPAETRQCGRGHERRRGEIVGQLLHAVATRVPYLLKVSRGHRLPRKDVKQLMSEIEVAPTGGFVARDQDGVHFRKTAGRTRDASLRFDHQDQHAEFRELSTPLT